MDSRENLNFHITLFRLGGIWPSKDGSIIYEFWTYFFNIIICVGFPLTQMVCVFYVDSVAVIVGLFVITVTNLITTVKALIIRAKKKQFDKLLQVMQEIDLQIPSSVIKTTMTKISNESTLIKNVFSMMYLSCWTSVALQVIFSPRDERIWSSTFPYPYGIMHEPVIYFGILIYQVIGNGLSCLLDAALDSYPPILLHILDGYIEVLGYRLRELGNNSKISTHNITNSQKMIKICEDFLAILR